MQNATLKQFKDLEKSLVKKFNLVKSDIKNPNGDIIRPGYIISTIYGNYILRFSYDTVQVFGRFEDVSKVSNEKYNINLNTGKYNFHFNDVLNLESFLSNIISKNS